VVIYRGCVSIAGNPLYDEFLLRDHGTAAMPWLPAVVKLLSKRWWIPVGERLEGPKFEPEGPKAEVGFPTADHM